AVDSGYHLESTAREPAREHVTMHFIVFDQQHFCHCSPFGAPGSRMLGYGCRCRPRPHIIGWSDIADRAFLNLRPPGCSACTTPGFDKFRWGHVTQGAPQDQAAGFPRSRSILAMRRSISTGLVSYSSHPASIAFSRSPLMAWAVNPITGTLRVLSSDLTRRVASHPSITGRL